MFRNYLKIGIRNLLKHRSHSLINIGGLAAGISCCLFIVLYIADELSYDRYHEKADRIYRVTLPGWAKMPPAFAPAMRSTYDHLTESAVRLWPMFSPAKVRHDDVVFVENGGVFADADVLSVFSWPMISGNPATALRDANTVVLTATMAAKYFGPGEAVGKSIEFWGQEMTVTGVMHDLPSNSHLKLDFLISFPTLRGAMGNDLDENWEMPAFYTYILSSEGTSPEDISDAAAQVIAAHTTADASRPLVQPLTSIHLNSNLEGEFAPGGNIGYLYTLATAAIIVLLLACINFTNLTTARAATRTKEVGIRKVMGARRRQLIGQFFGEALIISIAASLIAFTMVNLLLPAFNNLSGKSIALNVLSDPLMMFGALSMVVLLGLAAGAYPALYLSKFQPVNVLKGGSLPVSNLLLRKGLIVFQFTLSTVFLIGMAVVIAQLNYLQSKDLGFNKEHVLVLDGDNFPQVAVALKGVAGVEHVAGIPQIFGGPLPMSPYKAEGVYTDSLTQMRRYGVTHAFIETMGIELLAGRSFSDGFAAATDEGFILNEQALRALGWNDREEAIGRSFAMSLPAPGGGDAKWREGKVIGVVGDFNYEPLYRHVQPVVLYTTDDLNLTLVRVRNVGRGLIESVKTVWDKVNPDSPFNYYFLDSHLEVQYASERKLGNFMAAATLLAIVIACLGLFALVAFSAAQRTREIGIRKVLGATVAQIVSLLSLDFLKLVFLAVLLALPIAYAAMSRWLDNFAYHIGLSWFLFAGAGMLAIVIAVMTVGYQSLKAAHADPAESIRHE